MHSDSSVQLSDVQAVYSGPEFSLWELLMGQQIHIGGLRSSEQLADRAGIRAATTGVDLCCCTGGGLRFLLRHRQVGSAIGVDATEAMVDLGRQRCQQEGVAHQVQWVVADACHTGLPDAVADFVWGEDAWCYVVDKPALIAEAIRLVRPGGVVAFTDWVEGPAGISDGEAERLLRFMKFPNIEDCDGYRYLLTDRGCDVQVCEETGLFASHVDLYLDMLRMQLTSDALRIVGYNRELLDAVIGEMIFMQQLAHEGKIAQGRFVATVGQ